MHERMLHVSFSDEEKVGAFTDLLSMCISSLCVDISSTSCCCFPAQATAPIGLVAAITLAHTLFVMLCPRSAVESCRCIGIMHRCAFWHSAS